MVTDRNARKGVARNRKEEIKVSTFKALVVMTDGKDIWTYDEVLNRRDLSGAAYQLGINLMGTQQNQFKKIKAYGGTEVEK